jgi:hypothetical protein
LACPMLCAACMPRCCPPGPAHFKAPALAAASTAAAAPASPVPRASLPGLGRGGAWGPC